MNSDNPLLVVIAGPTAVGKTAAGIVLARRFSAEIISADSRQFYREMRIGTAVPSDDELALVRHHFIRHLSVTEPYNVSRFETDTLALLENIFTRLPVVFMVGGSGLYIDAVCHGIDLLPDPDPVIRQELKSILAEKGTGPLREELVRIDPGYAATIDLSNPVRLIRAIEICRITGVPFSALRSNKPKVRPFRILKLGLELPREELTRRINGRVDAMMAAGLYEEALALYPLRHLNALNTVGYRELFDHFDGLTPLDEAVAKIKTNTRRYAKRQMTWFRRDKEIMWFAPDDTEKMSSLVKSCLPG